MNTTKMFFLSSECIPTYFTIYRPIHDAVAGNFHLHFPEMCQTARVHHLTSNTPMIGQKGASSPAESEKVQQFELSRRSSASVSLAGFLDTPKPPASSAKAATANLSRRFPLTAKTPEYIPGFTLQLRRFALLITETSVPDDSAI